MTMLTDKRQAVAGSRGELTRNRVLTLLFALCLLLLPALPTPEYWITLGNYIGLYSIVAIGTVLLTGSAA